MNNNFTEELRIFWNSTDVSAICGAGTAAGFCCSEHMNMVKMTAPKPLQDKALSKGGGG